MNVNMIYGRLARGACEAAAVLETPIIVPTVRMHSAVG